MRETDQLIKEIESLTSPRFLRDFLRDATGTFVPGFAALPSVAILSKSSWKTRIKPEAEKWRTGDLIALRSMGPADEGGAQQMVMFTPVGEVKIPLVDVTPAAQASRFAKVIKLKPKDLWESETIQFAFLPWDADRERRAWTSEEIRSLAEVLAWMNKKLTATLKVWEYSLSLELKWGVAPVLGEPIIDSLRFPMNYAASMVSPFIFRLRIPDSVVTSDGRERKLKSEGVELLFSYPEQDLRELYGQARVPEPDHMGISIFGHAVPVANVDLKAWELGEPFAESMKAAGMKPLGVAGLFPYTKARSGKRSEEAFTGPGDTIFSLQIDPEGSVLFKYEVPGEKDTESKKQLFMWMTDGAKLNGGSFRYHDFDIMQPLQKRSNLLQQTLTVVPCFGGYDCRESGEENWYNNLMLNYQLLAGALLCKATLAYTVNSLLAKLGYRDITVAEPVVELRSVGGIRQRVVVVYLREGAGRPLQGRDMAVIQGFLDEKAPLGTKIVLEKVKRCSRGKPTAD